MNEEWQSVLLRVGDIHLVMCCNLHLVPKWRCVLCCFTSLCLLIVLCLPLGLHFLEVLFFAPLSLALCLHLVGTSMLHSADCAMNNEIASTAASLDVNCIPKRDTCLCDGC